MLFLVHSRLHTTHYVQCVKTHKSPHCHLPICHAHGSQDDPKLSSDLRRVVQQVRATHMCRIAHLLISRILPSIPHHPYCNQRFPNDRIQLLFRQIRTASQRAAIRQNFDHFQDGISACFCVFFHRHGIFPSLASAVVIHLSHIVNELSQVFGHVFMPRQCLQDFF